MKKLFTFILLIAITAMSVSHAQLNFGKALKSATKAVKAATLTDAQMAAYAKEYVEWIDTHNPLCEGEDPYAVRLADIIKGIDMTGLNIKAYRVIDINSIACADGSIRVFAGLMDIMSDEEILGIIGNSIGHVKNKSSKDSFRTALMASALREGVSSAGGDAAKLSNSQLGDLSEAIANAGFSKSQVHAADKFGYDFLKSQQQNPWAMALAFEKLKKIESEMSATNSVPQFFASHPDLDKRIARMAEMAQTDGFERPATTEPTTVTAPAE